MSSDGFPSSALSMFRKGQRGEGGKATVESSEDDPLFGDDFTNISPFSNTIFCMSHPPICAVLSCARCFPRCCRACSRDLANL